MSSRRPRLRLPDARRAVIELVLPVGQLDGARAVLVREALEDLEDAAIWYGAGGGKDEPAPPATADEARAARAATEERTAELDAARRLRRG